MRASNLAAAAAAVPGHSVTDGREEVSLLSEGDGFGRRGRRQASPASRWLAGWLRSGRLRWHWPTGGGVDSSFAPSPVPPTRACRFKANDVVALAMAAATTTTCCSPLAVGPAVRSLAPSPPERSQRSPRTRILNVRGTETCVPGQRRSTSRPAGQISSSLSWPTTAMILMVLYHSLGLWKLKITQHFCFLLPTRPTHPPNQTTS